MAEMMNASVERRQNAKHEPDVYFFEGETFEAVRAAMNKAAGDKSPRLYFRMGRKLDGSPEAWVQVRSSSEYVGTYNISQTCPPRPPEDCI